MWVTRFLRERERILGNCPWRVKSLNTFLRECILQVVQGTLLLQGTIDLRPIDVCSQLKVDFNQTAYH